MASFELEHEYETARIWRAGGAAKLELNRPDRMNAWNTQFGHDVGDAVKRLGEDEAVRAVMITGAGRGFSSGADLKEGFEPGEDGRPDVRSRLRELYHPIIVGIRRMEKPVIAAVNGPAVGIGCSLALACDLILAAESAYFLLAFVNIGLTPDGGSSVFIPARIGHARAAELAMLGERLPAPRALEWGLINRVVRSEALEAEATELLEKLANGPTRSYAGTKRQLNQWIYDGLEDQLELEAEIQQGQAKTDDFVEGVAAFIERREAKFAGR
jgi:2-(1,2-epoxy-1,2-dihydrophenyl)acetyl-CoA isomerase